MNRTIKDATVKRHFYESHEQLRSHLCDFVNAYNFARRLRTLKGLTRTSSSAGFGRPNQTDTANPLQKMPGRNS